MGVFARFFSSNKPSEQISKKCDSKTVDGEENVMESKPVFKKNTWEYKDDMSLSLTADNVAFIEREGKEEVADQFVWKQRIDKIFGVVVDSVKQCHTSYCPIPAEVEIYFKSKTTTTENKNSMQMDSSAIDTKTASQNESIIVREPRWTFDDIYISPNILDEVNRTLLIAKHRDKLFDEWKLGNGQDTGRAIVFNFYGPSGTGKSMTGEAIASYLGKKIYAVNYSELESKYVGETPKNIVAAFKKAQADNAVLIFDEADSFLGKRLTNVTQSADYGVNITRSVMLLELEKFDGIVIFTTNLVTNYDEAFKRRILTSVRFNLPDEFARNKIWEIYLNRGLPLAQNVTSEGLAKKYNDISGADIKDMLLHAAISAIYKNEQNPIIGFEDFDSAFQMIISRRTNKQPQVTVQHETISAAQFEEETNI